MMNLSFSHPLYVMLKPAGALCNLRCRYCYYLEKGQLYRETRNHVISDALLEKFISEYISSQTTPEVLFTWHGGEPLMRPISFYKRALALQRAYAQGHIISNCIQTNGTLLTAEWCEFLRDNHFLVGISIDGPEEFHDEYRLAAVNGGKTFSRVMHGIELLKKYDVEWNAMAVVNDVNADHPHTFYKFFKDIGCRYLQFTPIVERTSNGASDGTDRGPSSPLSLMPGMTEGGEILDFSVTPQQWGAFLCGVFDDWVKSDVGEVFVQIFDATLANWCGVTPGLCTLSSSCGHAGVMEFNGDVYSCDHFVFPEYKIGNIKEKTITELMYSKRQRGFSRMKLQGLPRQCRECRYEFACHGECPKNRFVSDRFGNPGMNYLCEGYRTFFEHVAPYMDFMRGELQAGRPPSNVMKNNW